MPGASARCRGGCRVQTDVGQSRLELGERHAGLEVEVERDERLENAASLPYQGVRLMYAAPWSGIELRWSSELRLGRLAATCRLGVVRRASATILSTSAGVERRRADADHADREHVAEVVLELETAADGVLEVGVDRRLEQRGDLEAVLDQQPAVADRDVARRDSLCAPRSANASVPRRTDERGTDRTKNSVGLFMAYSSLSGRSCTRTRSGSQKLTPIWNMTLLIERAVGVGLGLGRGRVHRRRAVGGLELVDEHVVADAEVDGQPLREEEPHARADVRL